MIFGIGTDIVEIKRIETMTSLDKFASKILSHNEKEFYDSLTNQKQIVYMVKNIRYKPCRRYRRTYYKIFLFYYYMLLSVFVYGYQTKGKNW